MALNQEDAEKIIEIIEKRQEEVLSANNINEQTDNNQYQWVSGIYQDIIQCLKSQF